MNRAEQIDAFCSALLGGPDGSGDDRLDGWSTYVWTLNNSRPKPAKTTLWSPAQPGSLASILHTEVHRQPDQLAAIYLSLGMAPDGVIQANSERHGEVVPANRRRLMAEDVQGITTLWADIDVAGPGHKSSRYPSDQAAAMQVAYALGIPPSIVVHSGGGLQPYWLLAEPWLTTDAADPAAEQRAMAELSRDLVNTLRYHAQRLGDWIVDSVFNLDRVMRAPGSFNTKTGTPIPVKLLHIDPAMRYDPDHIREHLAPDEVLAEFAQRSITGGATDLATTLPDVNLVVAWNMVRTAPQHLPEWLELLLELSPGSALEATWAGERPDLGNDPSSLDAALVRLLLIQGISTQRQVEAVMARRLSTGQKPDKVDPAVRTDYLLRTIANIHAAAAADVAKLGQRHQAINGLMARAASSHVSTTVTPDPGPHAAPEPDSPTRALAAVAPQPQPDSDAESGPDVLADYANQLIAGESDGPEPDDEPDQAAVAVAARAVVQRKRQEQENAEPDPDPWGDRHPDAVAALGILSELLLPGAYQQAGVQIWRLEERDRGPVATGRMVLRFPPAYDWPAGNRPKLYRPGLPLYCEWWKRDDFETPKAFRRSLERDAKIIAQQVGANKDDWIAIISALVPYWMPDSSGTDMTTQMHEWLLEYLIGRPATPVETEAATAGRPLLVNHAGWGVRGAPTIFVQASSFLAYIATQPGGRSGREALGLLDHLHVEMRRPRIEVEGKHTRRRWFEISPTEFTPIEWHDVLLAAKEAADGRERRNMRLLQGGA